MRKLFAFFATILCVHFTFAQTSTNKHFIKIESSTQNARMQPKELMRQKLEMNSDEEMKSLKTEKDDIGFEHIKYQHFYKGIKVEGSTYTIHRKEGLITHMTGNYGTVEAISISPSISDATALETAKLSTHAKEFSWETNSSNGLDTSTEKPTGELVVIQDTPNGYKSRLAYKYHIMAQKPFVNAYVFVDAETNEVLSYRSEIKHADAVGSAATRYSGSQTVITDSNSGTFRLRDYSRGDGILTYDGSTGTSASNSTGVVNGASDYRDSNNDWTAAEFDNSDKDNAGLDAHFAAELTYDFFMTNFGRDSYDGNGAAIISYVNTDIEDVFGYPSGYNDNAFWTGYVMVYGKGNSLDPLTTVDITAHEIGHAFCTGTADLVYENESGAMNEGLSDIWGACVEYYANVNYGTNKDLWNLGTEIGQTFRSMSNPKGYGDPDTYGGTYWVNQNCSPTGNNDYCGVHTNSGVTNHWFYVLAAGETDTNDIGDSYSVTGIGVDDAAAITWRTEAVYLSSTSDYADFRLYSIQSAVELFGSGSSQEIAVTNAWYAVGVGSEYVTTCALAAPTSLVASNIGDNGFTLNWSAVSGASSYTVTIGSITSIVTSTSYTTLSLLEGTSYSCFVVANCTTGGSGASSSLSVTTNGTAPVSYCASNGNSTSDEYIGNVELGSITNLSSASSGGYGDYTSLSTTLTPSSTYTITVTPIWTGAVYNEAYAVWVDYNMDGDFDDSSEEVWTFSATSSTSVSGSFTVPSSATAGTTRMRVSMKYNGIPTSCESFPYGEVEDYTVVIGSGSVDSQAPTDPSSLVSSSVTTSSFSVDWTASSDNVEVVGYNVYLNSAFEGSASGTSYAFTGLSESTVYSVEVEAYDAAGNVSGLATATVTTSSSTGCFDCIDFDEVTIGSYSNQDSDGSYSILDDGETILLEENTWKITTETYTISSTSILEFDFRSTSEGEIHGVGFDVDNNLSSNRIFKVYGTQNWGITDYDNYSGSSYLTYSIAVGSEYTGSAMSLVLTNDNDDGSGNNSYFSNMRLYDGVSSIVGFNGVNEVSEKSILFNGLTIYPNPSSGVINVSLEIDGSASMKIFNLEGKELKQVGLTDSENVIDVSDLELGVYLIHVRNGDNVMVSKISIL